MSETVLTTEETRKPPPLTPWTIVAHRKAAPATPSPGITDTDAEFQALVRESMATGVKHGHVDAQWKIEHVKLEIVQRPDGIFEHRATWTPPA